MEQDFIVGRLIREYGENHSKLALIRLELRSAGSGLSTLTGPLADRPESIRIDDGGLHAGEPRKGPNGPTVPVDAIAAIRDLLGELSDAAQERERMESDLRELGLAWVVRSNNSPDQEDH